MIEMEKNGKFIENEEYFFTFIKAKTYLEKQRKSEKMEWVLGDEIQSFRW